MIPGTLNEVGVMHKTNKGKKAKSADSRWVRLPYDRFVAQEGKQLCTNGGAAMRSDTWRSCRNMLLEDMDWWDFQDEQQVQDCLHNIVGLLT